MKALFIGGGLSSLAGLAMGAGMALPPEQPAAEPYIQPASQLSASGASESTTYGDPYAGYPAAYVVNTAYSSGPLYDLRPEVVTEPVANVSYDEPAIDRVLKSSWTDDPAPAAKPQEVAAAGDTRPAEPTPQDQVRTFASIDAVLAAAQDARPGSS